MSCVSFFCSVENVFVRCFLFLSHFIFFYICSLFVVVVAAFCSWSQCTHLIIWAHCFCFTSLRNRYKNKKKKAKSHAFRAHTWFASTCFTFFRCCCCCCHCFSCICALKRSLRRFYFVSIVSLWLSVVEFQYEYSMSEWDHKWQRWIAFLWNGTIICYYFVLLLLSISLFLRSEIMCVRLAHKSRDFQLDHRNLCRYCCCRFINSLYLWRFFFLLFSSVRFSWLYYTHFTNTISNSCSSSFSKFKIVSLFFLLLLSCSSLFVYVFASIFRFIFHLMHVIIWRSLNLLLAFFSIPKCVSLKIDSINRFVSEISDQLFFFIERFHFFFFVRFAIELIVIERFTNCANNEYKNLTANYDSQCRHKNCCVQIWSRHLDLDVFTVREQKINRKSFFFLVFVFVRRT